MLNRFALIISFKFTNTNALKPNIICFNLGAGLLKVITKRVILASSQPIL